MKDYIEMTEDVLCRSKNIIKKKKRAVRAAASSVLCLCLVAVMGAGVWMTGVRRNDPQIPEETIAATEPAVTGDAVPTESKSESTQKPDTSAPEISSAPNDTIVLPAIDESRVLWQGGYQDLFFLRYNLWNGKYVDDELISALNGKYVSGITPKKDNLEETPIYAILMTVHEGDYYDTRYGMTDEPKCFYQGQELTQIFNNESVEKQREAEAACIKECAEFQRQKLPEVQKFLAERGIRSEYITTKENYVVKMTSSYLIIFATSEEFASISFSDIGCGSDWNARFHWASKLNREGRWNQIVDLGG